MRNWKRILCGILIAGLGVQIFGCASAPKQEESAPAETIRAFSDTEAAVAAADFSVKLLQNSEIGTENCILSPYSILIAMAMTANGADGETLAQMEAAFGMPMEAVNRWLSSVCAESGEELISANSVWIREQDSTEIFEDYIRTNENSFQAQIFSAPFNGQTLDDINRWVNEHTKQRIPSILDSLDADAMMVLLNALSFDAVWQSPYRENELYDGQFTASDGTVQDVTMMCREEAYYLEDEMATGFLKDYEGGRYSYVVLLPKQGVSVQEYIASLSGQQLLEKINNASEETVWTQMPAFTAETSADMSQALQAMGITDAFSSAADFSKIGDFPMNIGQVLHKTYLKVHAGGTEAAAATAVMVLKGAMPPQERKKVNVDRPYVMAIVDRQTNAIMFLGAVNSISTS